MRVVIETSIIKDGKPYSYNRDLLKANIIEIEEGIKHLQKKLVDAKQQLAYHILGV